MVSFKAVAGCSYVSRQLFYVYFIAILSENQIEKIHFTALKILQVVGVNFHNYEALKIFEKAGAIVDFRSENVKITENLIKYALAQAPSEFCMYDREMEKEYVWGDSELKLGTGGSVINILDSDGCYIRPPITAPITMAGLISQQSAELLSGLFCCN